MNCKQCLLYGNPNCWDDWKDMEKDEMCPQFKLNY